MAQRCKTGAEEKPSVLVSVTWASSVQGVFFLFINLSSRDPLLITSLTIALTSQVVLMVASEILDRSIRLREMEPCNWCLCGWGGGDEVVERLNEKWKERACPNENYLLCLQRVLCDSLFWPKQTAGREFIHRRGADKRVDLSQSLFSTPVSIFSNLTGWYIMQPPL